ncbi:MAG: helix-turn-helix domain-containing protein [Nitrososphaerales archaeon]
MGSSDLVLSLDEFGLGRYEAKAYLTLLSKGSLSASEIAYYANLPRTKVYSTVTKLSKKGLVAITQNKPLVCNAIPPGDAFGDFLTAQEKKISEMKNVITKLEDIFEESNKPHGSEERKFLMLDPDSVLTTLSELVLDTRKEITCAIDGWGLRILSQCKHTVLKSGMNTIDVRILADKRCLGNDFLTLPFNAMIRINSVAANLFMFDRSAIVMVDSSNGKGMLFKATDVLTNIYSKMLDLAWETSIDASPLLSLDKALADTAIKLVDTIDHNITGYMADTIINNGMKRANIIPFMETNGTKLDNIELSDMLKVVNASLKISCSASLRYDKIGNVITIESNGSKKRIMPWALLLSDYLANSNVDSSILAGSNNGRDFVHIKLEKS